MDRDCEREPQVWHPEMTKLRERIDSGDLGIILHCEATMTFPNALLLKPDAWRADAAEIV